MHGLFIGTTTIDLIYPLPSFPKENTKNRAEHQLIDIGGPATNAAFTFSALGEKATLVSLIGQNPFSNFTKEKLRQYNINHVDLNSNLEQNQVISSILVNTQNGSRTITDVAPILEKDFKIPKIDLLAFDIICIDGFFGAFVLLLLKQDQLDIPIVFDGGSFKKYTDQLLDFVTYPIFSEKFQPPNSANLRTYLAKKGIQKFAITRGEKSIKVFENESKYEIHIPKIKAIDTLAAGDIFHGAFCKYILDTRHDFRAALQMASKIAILSCQYIGPRAWVETLS